MSKAISVALLSLSLIPAALAQEPVPAQPAAEAAPATPDPALPRVSAQGEALAQRVFNHRVRIGQLSEDLELYELELKIEEAKVAKAKLLNPEPSATLPPNPLAIPVDSTGLGPYTGTLSARAIPEAPPPPPAAPPEPPAVPRLVGVIGTRALFIHDGNPAFEVAPGEMLGDYKVAVVNPRSVILEWSKDRSVRVETQLR